MTKIAGSGSESGSISQRHESTDPDAHQNVMGLPKRTRSVPMKGVLLWLVRWAADTRDFCHALAALVSTVQYIFPSPYTIALHIQGRMPA